MTRFDEMLRRGLMDANLAQFEPVLLRANDMQPDFSPRYLRERTRMLADPWEWARRRSVRRRIDWRLIAIAAALLLLSACAYAVATGQFSQWFPQLGVDPEAPEVSEEVLARTGTVIQQSQTVDGVTVNLNAAVWDGEYLYLSFDIEGMDVPMDEVRYGYPLWTADCRLFLREDQREEYAENRAREHFAAQGIEPTPEQLEAEIQENMKIGNGLGLFPDEVEEHRLSFQDNQSLYAGWFTETTRPELTLHLENIGVAIYGEYGYPTPGEVFIEGPFDLTFTLEEPILPIQYRGANAEVTMYYVPLRFTEFEFSVTGFLAKGETLAPIARFEFAPEGGRAPDTDPDNLTTMDLNYANIDGPWGVWTEDGKYVDLTPGSCNGGGMSEKDDGFYDVTMGRIYFYPIDPVTVTAVNVGGVRVELSDLEVVPAE